MDLVKHGMKGPTRPAPMVPGFKVNRYSPVSNWNDDPFGADVFEPMPSCTQKKKPPPRPPPPKINSKCHPEIPVKPSHFNRRPTVLSSLLTRKNRTAVTETVTSNQTVTQQTVLTGYSNNVDASKMFPRCEPKNVQTGALIDLSSPPSSPTFTTRSSSDGLSVDSFGSDATTSTSHPHTTNGGNASQAESGFEDDFDLFLNTRKNGEDSLDDLNNIDPFSPQPTHNKPPIMKKPVLYSDLLCNGKTAQTTIYSQQQPTIIRAKPARPKPPDSTSILKSTFGNTFMFPSMNVNTTTPIQRMSNGFGDNFGSKPLSWSDESSPEREQSPPMPTIPPPPPPQIDDEEDTSTWTRALDETPRSRRLPQHEYSRESSEVEEPYGIALYDYHTEHEEDLSFSANARIKLIRRENEEWLYGSLRNGAQGMFPANFVDIKIPLPNEKSPSPQLLGMAAALYDFEPSQPGDLKLTSGGTVLVMCKLNDEWYYGECNGMKGQFPANYVQFN